ncbi:helix-turn-helix transcriptional regulator [Marvinbryantia formatexigens]|nr:AraC family transcriptional regulator [Marvinbryantia formatexigens]UWO24327.1 AraC family transcriptional regulator [Marvinbryantia formatexigens DSM 14469]SDF53895.1 transcriptional regulator, AraC family [Marvinbryantia formatexigens]
MKKITEQCRDAVLLAESDGCQVYQFRNETGEGTITLYEVFPGVALAYNDFHMRYYNSVFEPGRDLFCIDHCREGRLEYAARDNACGYVEAGDLKLDRRLTHSGRFEMPLSHYHGVMISFDMETACRTLPQEIKDFPVNLQALQKKFCKDIYPVVLRGGSQIAHIFAELYAVPEQIKRAYFKIKILELLLFLEALQPSEHAEEKPYFYKPQVEKTKALQQFLLLHLDENFTQEELSGRFDIPQTTMKKCFKSIFGATIGAYVTECRMNRAAVLLKTSRDMSVAEIAGRVGYDSPSKFAMAFRRQMGMSPAEYRKRR